MIKFFMRKFKKEFEVGKKDYASAIASFEASNFKWATIQAYYAIFHAMGLSEKRVRELIDTAYRNGEWKLVSSIVYEFSYR